MRAPIRKLIDARLEYLRRDAELSWRVCTRCGTRRWEDWFSRRRHLFRGFSSWCKECHRVYKRDLRRRHREGRFVDQRLKQNRTGD
jgi:hypothetical protein